MKKNLLAAAGLAALMALPTAAFAQDGTSGWYLRGNVGGGVFDTADFTGDLVGDVEGEGNLSPSVGIGYEFDNNWRLELDGTYLWNDTAKIQQLPSTSSDFRTYSAMLNAIYDFDDFGRWEPYIGAGVGLVRARLSAETHDFPSDFSPSAVPVTNAACSPICDFSDKDTTLGWQLLAGLGYKITENLSWDTHYKYMNLSDLDFEGTRRSIGATATNAITTQMLDAESHFLGTGFRYRFGGATPPPPPPPPPPPMSTKVECWNGVMVDSLSQCAERPPVRTTQVCWDGSVIDSAATCPSRPVVETPVYTCWDGQTTVTDLAQCPPPPVIEEPRTSFCDQGDTQFVVYFEWDKSRLTNEAAAVVDQASTIAQSCGISGVILEGHADSSGNASYNVGLSNRRANTVKSALVSRGFQSTNITTEARGESQLAVQTGDNVREPLNRRTEVIIRLVPGSDTMMFTQ